MNIESKPIRQSRTYWGNITIPEIITAEGKSDITFTIEKWEDNTDISHPVEGINIHSVIKNKDFRTFRGKEQKLLYDRVIAEVVKQKIEL